MLECPAYKLHPEDFILKFEIVVVLKFEIVVVINGPYSYLF